MMYLDAAEAIIISAYGGNVVAAAMNAQNEAILAEFGSDGTGVWREGSWHIRFVRRPGAPSAAVAILRSHQKRGAVVDATWTQRGEDLAFGFADEDRVKDGFHHVEGSLAGAWRVYLRPERVELDDRPFDEAPNVQAIRTRLAAIDVGWSLRGEGALVVLSADDEGGCVRVSYDAKDGSRRVVAGPLTAVAKHLRRHGYSIRERT